MHDPEQTIRMQQEILDRLTAVAGVHAAGFSSSNDGLPLDGDGRTSAIFVDGRPADAGVKSLREIQSVSPQFFETLQTPWSWAAPSIGAMSIRVVASVLVSENLARNEWGSATAALGQRIGTNGSGPWSEVVGVVQDVHHYGLNQPAPETVIFPPSARNTVASFVIRSERVGTTGFLNDLRRAVWSVNQNLSLANVQTLDDLYQLSMARTSLTLQLLAITGAMALTLGLVGIYGVVSYTVSQRRREIGIRLALGAEQGEVRRMFVRHALVLVGIGVAIGLGAAMGLTRLMESQLFGVSRLDPPAYAAVAAVLMASAMVASYIPARRAARVDPLVALRYE